MAYGATREEWHHFSRTLGLVEDLLPVVSNPTAPINPNSQLGQPGKDGRLPKPGKVPSLYDNDRLVVGLPRWTQMRVSTAAVAEWKREPDYGICVQTRYMRAIDVDVPNRLHATIYRQAIEDCLGIKLPERFRADTGKFLLVFAFDEPIIWPKRKITVEGGVIEFLGDGQQFIAAGTHPDGAKYEWMGGVPDRIPVVSLAEIEKLWSRLDMLYAIGKSVIARAPGERLRLSEDIRDDRYDWLVDNWTIFDTGNDDQLFLACPFEGEHSTDSGISSTAYFPAGRGGYNDENGEAQVYQRGHWRCLHAHCEGRDDQDFDEACGYAVSSFPNLPAVVEPEDDGSDMRIISDDMETLGMKRSPVTGKADWTITNLVAALRLPIYCGMWLAYDQFLDQIVWAEPEYKPGRQAWKAFGDEHYTKLRIMLERKGIRDIGKETLREVVYYAARDSQIDTAMEWLARLKWDGVHRIDNFFPTYFGIGATDYSRAVSRYTWTALAGRVMDPGCQADMTPVLIGGQGTRKSSAIAAMAPSDGAYVKIDLGARDTDLSRKLRGKLVGEFDELRGLGSREAEDIKAWLTQRKEEWVPKFKEFGSFFKRRLLFLGSGNRQGFLADPTGERRWLPMDLPRRGQIAVEQIVDDRDQLWAEALVQYRKGGIAWREAEALARDEHHRFKMKDVWREYIIRWAETADVRQTTPWQRGFTMSEALVGALQMNPGHSNQNAMLRIERILTDLGMTEDARGVWRVPSVLD